MTFIHVYASSASRDTGLYPNGNNYVLHMTTPVRDISKVELLYAFLPNMNTIPAVFLDISELRTPFNIDAKSITSTNTFSGQNMARSFAMIPTDFSGTNIVKQFNKSDFDWAVEYPTPIRKLDRLTIKWTDQSGSVVVFPTNDNSCLLRFHTITRNFEQ